MARDLLEWSQHEMVVFCVNVANLVYGMNSYNDYITPVWTDCNKPLIMSLPSSITQ